MEKYVWYIVLSAAWAFWFPWQTRAQVPNRDSGLNDLLEQIAADGGDETALLQIRDELERLADSPISLNSVKESEIHALPFLREQEARTLILLRRRLGGFSGWDQVQTLAALRPNTLALLRQSAWIDPRDDNAPFTARFDLRYRQRFEQERELRKGYQDGTWDGARYRSSHRLTFADGDAFAAGLVSSRDPGERGYADHASAFLHARDAGLFEDIILGEFSVSAGRGLVLGAGTRGTGTVRSCGTGSQGEARLVPRLSSSGMSPERGLALLRRDGGLSMIGFATSRLLDGRIDSATGMLTSINESGLHRSESEIQNRGVARKVRAGAVAGYEWTQDSWLFSLIGCGAYTRFSHRLNARSPWDFGGLEAATAGLSVEARSDHWSMFSESAISVNGAIATVAGATASPVQSVHTVCMLRNYGPSFHSIYGNTGIASGNAPRNERGFSFFTGFTPSPLVTIEIAFDQFRNPVPGGSMDLPASGGSMEIGLLCRPSSAVRFDTRWEERESDDHIAIVDVYGRDIRPCFRRRRQSVRLELTYEGALSSRVRLRVERCSIRWTAIRSPEHGTLASVDLSISPARWLRGSARLAFYETDSYESRLYSSEVSTPGAGLTSAAYGRGARASAAIQAAWSWGSVSAAWVSAIRPGALTIGSGADAISGDTQGKVSLQLDMRI